MPFFFRLARAHRRIYAAAFVVIVLTNLAEISLIRLTAVAVEAVVARDPVGGIVAGIVGLSIVVFLLRWSNRNLAFWAGRRAEAQLRVAVFSGIVGLDQEQMDRHRSGDLVSRIVNDVSDIRMVLGAGFLQVSNTAMAYATTLFAMFTLDPQLALAGLVPFFPLFFVGKKLTAMSYERSARSQNALGSLSALVEETVSGIEVVKSYDAAGWQKSRFESINREVFSAEDARIRPESALTSSLFSAVWVGIATILFAAAALGSYSSVAGHGLADLATFVFLFARLVWPSVALGWIANVIQRGRAAAERVREFAEAPNAAPTGENLSGAGSDVPVEIRGASYTYPGKTEPALRGIDLMVGAGEWVGIVGPTGSGKTTLARLVAGLRKPQAGSVSVFGAPIGFLGDRERQGLVHYAAQTPQLFSLSIEENLRLAATGAAGDLREALRDASLSEEVSRMPHEIGTIIGEKGVLLSGGQRQRLALARAYVADAPVLVLDDVFSAVDVETEHRIIEAMRRRALGENGRRGSTILVTHRFAALAAMDRVIVLSRDGRVEAAGPLSKALHDSEWLAAAYEAETIHSSLRGQFPGRAT